MKKLIAAIAAAMITLSMTIPAFAENENSVGSQASVENSVVSENTDDGTQKNVSFKEYTLSDIGMTIKLPENMYILTRDIDENDPALAACNLTKETVLKNFKASDTYIKASEKNFLYDITVTMVKNSDTSTIDNLTALSDDEVQGVIDNLLKQKIYTGCAKTKFNNTLFLALDLQYDSSNTKIYGIQEYTVIKGTKVVITFQSYNGEITDNQKSLLNEIMNSVTFEGISSEEQPSDSASISINSLDKRYIYMIIGSVIGVAALASIIILAMKYSSQNKKDKDNADKSSEQLPVLKETEENSEKEKKENFKELPEDKNITQNDIVDLKDNNEQNDNVEDNNTEKHIKNEKTVDNQQEHIIPYFDEKISDDSQQADESKEESDYINSKIEEQQEAIVPPTRVDIEKKLSMDSLNEEKEIETVEENVLNEEKKTNQSDELSEKISLEKEIKPITERSLEEIGSDEEEIVFAESTPKHHTKIEQLHEEKENDIELTEKSEKEEKEDTVVNNDEKELSAYEKRFGKNRTVPLELSGNTSNDEQKPLSKFEKHFGKITPVSADQVKSEEKLEVAEKSDKTEEKTEVAEKSDKAEEKIEVAEKSDKAEEKTEVAEKSDKAEEKTEVAEKSDKAEEKIEVAEKSDKAEEKTEVAEKSDKAEEKTEVAEKSDKAEEKTEVAEKSDKAEEKTEVAEKSDKAEEKIEVAEKSDKAEEKTEVAEKSDKAEEKIEVAEKSDKAEEKTKVAEKSDKAEEKTEVAEKSDKAEEKTKVAEKSDKSEEKNKVAEKSDKAEEKTEVAEKSDKAEEKTEVAEKSDKTEELNKTKENLTEEELSMNNPNKLSLNDNNGYDEDDDEKKEGFFGKLKAKLFLEDEQNSTADELNYESEMNNETDSDNHSQNNLWNTIKNKLKNKSEESVKEDPEKTDNPEKEKIPDSNDVSDMPDKQQLSESKDSIKSENLQQKNNKKEELSDNKQIELEIQKNNNGDIVIEAIDEKNGKPLDIEIKNGESKQTDDIAVSKFEKLFGANREVNNGSVKSEIKPDDAEESEMSTFEMKFGRKKPAANITVPNVNPITTSVSAVTPAVSPIVKPLIPKTEIEVKKPVEEKTETEKDFFDGIKPVEDDIPKDTQNTETIKSKQNVPVSADTSKKEEIKADIKQSIADNKADVKKFDFERDTGIVFEHAIPSEQPFKTTVTPLTRIPRLESVKASVYNSQMEEFKKTMPQMKKTSSDFEKKFGVVQPSKPNPAQNQNKVDENIEFYTGYDDSADPFANETYQTEEMMMKSKEKKEHHKKGGKFMKSIGKLFSSDEDDEQ